MCISVIKNENETDLSLDGETARVVDDALADPGDGARGSLSHLEWSSMKTCLNNITYSSTPYNWNQEQSTLVDMNQMLFDYLKP